MVLSSLLSQWGQIERTTVHALRTETRLITDEVLIKHSRCAFISKIQGLSSNQAYRVMKEERHGYTFDCSPRKICFDDGTELAVSNDLV